MNKCFACDKIMKKEALTANADTQDGQTVMVGPDCLKRIIAAGNQGYQPPLGGPKLYGFHNA
jgi:hypothetical protein